MNDARLARCGSRRAAQVCSFQPARAGAPVDAGDGADSSKLLQFFGAYRNRLTTRRARRSASATVGTFKSAKNLPTRILMTPRLLFP